MRVALGRALFCGYLLFGAAALAEPAATMIVLVADDPSDDVAHRLQRDLRGLGFGVVVLGATPENSVDAPALERTARSLGAMAAVHVSSAERGSQLWVLEPTTNRSVTRELTLPPGSSTDANEVALGTLELLRASMLELHPPVAAAAPPRARPQPRAEPVRASSPKAPVFSLTAGLGAELGLRSVSPSMSALWAAWLKLGGCLGVRGFALLPVVGERATYPEGEVEVRPSLLGAGFSCSPEARASWLTPRASLGIALSHIETRGDAFEPSRSHQAATWLAGGYGLLGVGLRLSRLVQLDLDATGVVLPRPAAIFVQRRDVATWGAPAGVLSVAVEVAVAP